MNQFENKPKASGEGYFINGKAQAVEILKNLNGDEKERLLKAIRAKNPSMANELSENCIAFGDITQLNQEDLNTLCRYVDAQILGIALKGVPLNFQRKVLSNLNRNLAERAYNVLTTPMANEDKVIVKAKSKILDTMIQMVRRHQIRV